MKPLIRNLLRRIGSALRDLLPIAIVVVTFQMLVVRQPFPDVAGTVAGGLFVVIGLIFFVQGLEMGLFPIGESLAYSFARKGSLAWLLVFRLPARLLDHRGRAGSDRRGRRRPPRSRPRRGYISPGRSLPVDGHLRPAAAA